MRTQPQAIIHKLEADNSSAKEQVILEAMEQGLDEFLEGVTMALDPLVTFGAPSSRSNCRWTRSCLLQCLKNLHVNLSILVLQDMRHVMQLYFAKILQQ